MNKRIRHILDKLPASVQWRVKQTRDHYWLYIGSNPGVLIGNNSSRDKFVDNNVRIVNRIVEREIKSCRQDQK